jgi:hypothetical protein
MDRKPSSQVNNKNVTAIASVVGLHTTFTCFSYAFLYLTTQKLEVISKPGFQVRSAIALSCRYIILFFCFGWKAISPNSFAFILGLGFQDCRGPSLDRHLISWNNLAWTIS